MGIGAIAAVSMVAIGHRLITGTHHLGPFPQFNLGFTVPLLLSETVTAACLAILDNVSANRDLAKLAPRVTWWFRAARNALVVMGMVRPHTKSPSAERAPRPDPRARPPRPRPRGPRAGARTPPKRALRSALPRAAHLVPLHRRRP